MTTGRPEPWLRGPVAGIAPVLQPVAHAFLMAREDVAAAVEGLTPGELRLSPGGAASVGFHLAHLSGSTDRLLTYARGERLTDAQRAVLAAERAPAASDPDAAALLAGWGATVDRALHQLAGTTEATLLDARLVGRAGLPSNVLGLLFHAAEHAQRHAGQIVTTTRIIRGLPPGALR